MQPMRSISDMLKDYPFQSPLVHTLILSFIIHLCMSTNNIHFHHFTLVHYSPPHSPCLFTMASNSLHPLHHHATSRRRPRHSLDTTSPLPSSFFVKTNTLPSSLTLSLPSSTTSAAISATTTTTTTTANPSISFELLEEHLSAQNLRAADEVTRKLLIQLAGEAAQKRGYVFFSEVQFISKQDLQAIDTLWRKYSNNRFGYSVQKRIWRKLNGDFTKLFVKLGWMKKLENSEIEQYNYKAFPDDFFWEITDDVPEGHLPLTNALRGTQLFTCILTHPAFEDDQEDQDDGGYQSNFPTTNKQDPKPPRTNNTLFKPDYSF